MKSKILFATVFILMIPISFAVSQDKKSDQKVKIVINDGSGSKVIMDTTFSVSVSDGNKSGREYKEVTVISSDSTDGDANVKYHSNSNSGSTSSSNHHKKYKFITRNSQDSGHTFDVSANKSENDSTMNRTKYVIAKDGMVVTVEGNDEVKAKELVKEIENKLGVNIEDNKKKEK